MIMKTECCQSVGESVEFPKTGNSQLGKPPSPLSGIYPPNCRRSRDDQRQRTRLDAPQDHRIETDGCLG